MTDWEGKKKLNGEETKTSERFRVRWVVRLPRDNVGGEGNKKVEEYREADCMAGFTISFLATRNICACR